ncbi:hypothetical protein DD237_008305 [Peronospora effusa]|uniref:Reverse transcriptase domain-containing protein n=1 Tax=Peronospora effusa TaxID=542832 RepID=A0A425C9N4_9STRA|nr:hypothetical protein DD237_008305 [Peronospora effusa]
MVEALRLFGFGDKCLAQIKGFIPTRQHGIQSTASFHQFGELVRVFGSAVLLLPFFFCGSRVAIQTSHQLQGLTLQGAHTQNHIFFWVCRRLHIIYPKNKFTTSGMESIFEFGRLSGLQVQPTKSQIIFSNTAIHQLTYQGIAEVAPSTTTRYLGYQKSSVIFINWAFHIKNALRRFLTATRVSTTLEHRVLMLNAIAPPSILSTAAVFGPPGWALTQLDHLYKQFL